MGEEDDKRELKEGELQSARSTDRELGLSSGACKKEEEYSLLNFWSSFVDFTLF